MIKHPYRDCILAVAVGAIGICAARIIDMQPVIGCTLMLSAVGICAVLAWEWASE